MARDPKLDALLNAIDLQGSSPLAKALEQFIEHGPPPESLQLLHDKHDFSINQLDPTTRAIIEMMNTAPTDKYPEPSDLFDDDYEYEKDQDYA